MNPVSDTILLLFETPFHSRNLSARNDLLTFGRPTPTISVSSKDKKNNKIFCRSFNSIFYEKFPWLCGSHYTQKLFCWPCVLLGIPNTPWNKVGSNDFKNLSKSIKIHESTEEHINNYLKLKHLENRCSDLKLIAFRDNDILFKKQYNENVRLNRLMMKHFIDIVLYLGKPEFVFRGHDESSSSSSRSDFTELLNMLTTRCSPELLFHYNNNMKNTFPNLLNTIQDDLIQCISDYLSNKIKEEIKQCMFYSIKIGGAINILQKSYCSIILRFFTNESKLVERFLGFYDVSGDDAAGGMFNLIISTLYDFDMEHKLVSQCYNGNSVNNAVDLQDLQLRVQKIAPSALFTFGSENELSSVLLHAFSTNSMCRIFFAKLSGMSSYFVESISRSEIVNCIIRKQFPQLDQTDWASYTKMLHSIVDEQTGLIAVFEFITQDPKSSAESICGAVHNLETLKSFEFMFLAQIFKNIFLMAEVLFNTLQDKPFDVDYCLDQINETIILLGKNREQSEFLQYFNNAVTLMEPEYDYTNELNSKLEFKLLYYKVIDTVQLQLTTRFQNTSKLLFLQLADVTKFRQYSSQFPENYFNNINVAYSNIFQDKKKLKMELKILYKDKKYHYLQHIYELVQIFENDKIKEVLPEAYILFKLVLTIPITRVPDDESFFGLKLIKRYLHNGNNLSLRRLNSLATISIEKSTIQRLKDTELLYDDVINMYAAKESENINLMYKT